MTENSIDTTNGVSRRNLLKSAGMFTALAGMAGAAGADPYVHPDAEPTTDEEPDKTFELLAVKDAWVGRGPDPIKGEVNPTLNLEAGKKYRIKWLNGDGASHNFGVFGTDGNLLVFSPFMHAQGEYQTVEFTATEAMVDYYCEVHYLSMRGPIEVSGKTGKKSEPINAEYFGKGPQVGLKKVAGGFSYPVAFEVANEDRDRRFIVDQTGEVWVHQSDGTVRDKPFIDITDRLFREENLHPETGLLGMAFHPNFAENGKFYLRYSAPRLEGTPQSYHHTSVVSEFQAGDKLKEASPDSENIILKMPSPQSNHNSGNVEFGPDGLLYIPIGDGGFGGDTADMLGHVEGGNGQDIKENLLGSLLRIDVDGQEDGKPYAIPDDNPLVGKEGLDEHYAWGLRNPWGMSFDSQGRLFMGDVGRALFEEVNIIQKGGNYGWNIREGTHCFSPDHQADPPEECASQSTRGEPLLDPIIEYPHVFDGKPVGQAVVGGHVYEGDAIPELQGKYVFGDVTYSPVVPSGALLVASNKTGDGICPAPEGDVLPGEEDSVPIHKPNESPGTDELWEIDRLQVPGGGPRLNRFVIAIGEGQDGELYALTNTVNRREAKTGEVHKIVPADQQE